MVIAVNHFTGKFQQPIKQEILAPGASKDVDSQAVIGFMKIGGTRVHPECLKKALVLSYSLSKQSKILIYWEDAQSFC